jgi:hypothetical protein
MESRLSHPSPKVKTGKGAAKQNLLNFEIFVVRREMEGLVVLHEVYLSPGWQHICRRSTILTDEAVP